MITIVGDDQTELAPISHLNLSSSFMAKPKVINSNLTPDPKIQEELLNLKIRVKQKVINAIVNTRSQTNLISTSLVQKLRLETTPHSKPYPLGWIHKDVEMRIDYQCTFKFTITNKYIDEVTTEVVPLDICHHFLKSILIGLKGHLLLSIATIYVPIGRKEVHRKKGSKWTTNRPSDDYPSKEDGERMRKVCALAHLIDYNSNTSISLGIDL